MDGQPDSRPDQAGAVDRLAGLITAAGSDDRARRRLLGRASRVLEADAEAERRSRTAIVAAEQRTRAVEADADARIRAAEARVLVQERERAASRAEREAQRAEQASVRENKAEAAAIRRAKLASARDLLGAAAPATLSMLVYLAAVGSAVFGQVSVATGRYDWSLWRALMLAGFIELMALAMALTANRLRLRGERAASPSLLTWVFASFAAAVNVWGHWADPLMAAGLGAASLGGITLWEIRSSARHRDALRAAGMLAAPMPRMGWRMWVLYARSAAGAYRLAVRAAVSPAAAPLVQRAEAERAQRIANRAARRALRRGGAAAIQGDAIEVDSVIERGDDGAPQHGDDVFDALPDPWANATPLRLAAAPDASGDGPQHPQRSGRSTTPQQRRPRTRSTIRGGAAQQRQTVQRSGRSTGRVELSDADIAAAITPAVIAARSNGAAVPQREMQRLAAARHPGAPVPGARRIERIAAAIAEQPQTVSAAS